VAEKHRDHVCEWGWPAPERHGAFALFRGQVPEKGDERRPILAHFGKEGPYIETDALGNAGPIPIMDFEFGCVLEVVAGFGDAGADPDPDELAEVVGGHVGQQLAARPGAVPSVYDFFPA
jgi:hypothetical protein